MKKNHIILIGLIVLFLVTTGCAQKPVVEKGPGATVMVMTNHTTGTMTYDATPVTWNVEKSTLWSSGKPALHSECSNSYYPATPWSSGSPILAVQDWTAPWNVQYTPPVLTAATEEVKIIQTPKSVRLPVVKATFSGQWYAPEKKAFLLAYGITSSRSGVSITIQQASVMTGSSLQKLTVPSLPIPANSSIVYGSGDIDSGFILLDVPAKPTNNIAVYDLVLLRLHDGKAALVKCANPAGLNCDMVSDYSGTCAHVGSLLYFTHGNGKIGEIDTSAAAPVIIVSEKINTFVDGLRKTGGQDVGPVQALLASDNGKLIIGYPDVGWNWSYYAVDAAGTILGHLHVTGTALTSFDAEGHEGTSLKFRKMDSSLLFPSSDLFVN